MKKLFALAVGVSLVSLNLSAFEKPLFITACEGKAAGAACTFTNKTGKNISDKCVNHTNPKGVAELACGTPPVMQHGKPVPVKACEGKASGDACTFTAPNGKSVSDKCVSHTNPKGEAELACGSPKAK